MKNRLSSLKRTIDLATRPSLLTRQSFIVLSTLSCVGHIGSSSDLGSNAILIRIVISFLAAQPLFLLIWLVSKLTSNSSLALRAVSMFFVFMASGAIRGWIISYLLMAANIVPQSVSSWRIVNGIITVTAIASLQTYIFSAIAEIRTSSKSLKEQSQLLESSLKKLESESKTEAKNRAVGIAESILTQIQEINISPKEQQIQQIRNLVDDQVRPLTQALTQAMSSWMPERIRDEKPRLLDELQGINPVERLHVQLVSLLLAVAPFPQTRYLLGTSQALLISVLVWMTFTLTAKRLVPITNKLTKSATGFKQILATVLALEIVTLPTTIITAFLLKDSPNNFTLLYVHQVILITTGGSTILGRTFVERAENQIENLKLLNRKLRWTIARINLIMWFNQGVTARLLHGPIQNVLQASLIRAGNESEDIDVSLLIEELTHRIESIEGQNALHRDTIQELQNIGQLWTGISNVQIVLSDGFIKDIQSDIPATSIVLDLVQEIVSNAIRHGKAKNVSVSLSCDHTAIKLEFKDDGRPHQTTSTAGVGSRLLAECTIENSLNQIDELNVTYIEIPLLPSNK